MLIKSPADAVRKLAAKLNFPCEMISHTKTGKTSEQAAAALGVTQDFVIKALFLKSKTYSLAAIVRGTEKLDFQKLEALSGLEDLRMASPEEVKEELGFEIGGVPPIVFHVKHIRTFVDRKVFAMSYVIGSGGTQYIGMKFDPALLEETLGYISADISK